MSTGGGAVIATMASMDTAGTRRLTIESKACKFNVPVVSEDSSDAPSGGASEPWAHAFPG